jgi:hypothetical protein
MKTIRSNRGADAAIAPTVTIVDFARWRSEWLIPQPGNPAQPRSLQVGIATFNQSHKVIKSSQQRADSIARSRKTSVQFFQFAYRSFNDDHFRQVTPRSMEAAQ